MDTFCLDGTHHSATHWCCHKIQTLEKGTRRVWTIEIENSTKAKALLAGVKAQKPLDPSTGTPLVKEKAGASISSLVGPVQKQH